ncbi:hypothetical protein [Streptococcus suis]|uniref:hypothetical protein n=1 Tax=Streptococcus suis TaxID=1307 RepID=UPI000CF585A9|nr:hypothetical protein [Streptococcus suis]HEM2808756.1 hypothetical protein [Streptococcus suis]HEM6309417.1 hypothetical protein [Streptococcus suis]
MNKRIAKKYRPFRELWEALKTITFGMDFLERNIDAVADRIEQLEKIQSTNTQTINCKFEDYDKRIEYLERELKELKQAKKPFWKR